MSTELLFGSPAAVWPSLAAPTLGYLQPSIASIASANRTIAPAPPNIVMQTPAPFGGGFAGTTSPSNPVRLEALGGGPAFAGPSYGVPMIATHGVQPMSADFAGVVTAPALLAAVAARRGQPFGPTSDQEIEDFIGDALDLLPGSNDIEVRCDGGRATLSGQVSHKRLKRDAGEIAWAIPAVHDVQNNITIVARRRSRTASRESEPPAVAGRKQA